MIKLETTLLAQPLRPDHKAILNLVPSGASVLDLGCGNGELLFHLINLKGISGRGVEIDEQSIYQCVSLGLSVSHQDIDDCLAEYGDASFDYVVLNQSLQQVRQFEPVLKEALRVGRKVIVGFPNFAYIKARCQIFFSGHTPVTPSLPYQWYDTPNLHFLSIADFIQYCRQNNLRVEKTVYLDAKREIRLWPNLLAQTGIFVLAGRTEDPARQRSLAGGKLKR
ncbi:MAG: methionine biosynthesis protein MetW [Dehalococcoidales bacterium]|nr:methionine biosynthesis protein MetW [Dehalococcoidales bacterium]